MKALILMAVGAVLSGAALGQTPAPQPTPIPCWGMAGLEVGMDRTVAFERMARLDKAKLSLTHDLKVLHIPKSRPWTVDVSFDGPGEKAKITLLHYVVAPPQNLLEAMLERYGKATLSAIDPTSTYWNDTRCGLTIRYKPVLSETGQPVQEEVWVEPLRSGKKGR